MRRNYAAEFREAIEAAKDCAEALAAERTKVATLRAALLAYHKTAHSQLYCLWTPEMHQAQQALDDETEGKP